MRDPASPRLPATVQATDTRSAHSKQPYQRPHLKAHGQVSVVTLAASFGAPGFGG